MNDGFDYSFYDNLKVNEDDDVFHDEYILDRNDKQYINVEKFKDYELTSCVAFELAIRNDTVIKKLIEFYTLKNDLFACLDITGKINVKIHLKQKYIPDELKISVPSLYKLYFLMMELEKNYFLPDLFDIEEQFHSYNFIKLDYKCDQTYFDINKIVGDNYIIKESFDGFIVEQATHVNTLKYHRSDNSSLREKGTYPYKKTSTNNIISINKDSKEISESYKRNVALNNIEYITYKVKQKFSKPVLKDNPNISKLFNICNLNLNLPEKEIKSYLDHVYKELIKEKNNIKTPLEYLGKELKLKTINFKKFTAEEWADCLFIYDYNKISNEQVKTKRDKITEILNIKYKTSTMKERLKLMESLIDQEKYKILLNQLEQDYET